jgi:hypothetical protein
LLAGLAITGALVIYPAVQNVPLANAQGGECSNFPGYEQIEAENTGMYVDSKGPATADEMEPVGSCWKPTPVPSGDPYHTLFGHQVYTYYNEDDRCLYWNGNSTGGEIYTAKNANGCSFQPNEEFVGRDLTSSGWQWYNVQAFETYDFSWIYGYKCDNGGNLFSGAGSGYPNPDSCDYWNFPSDGG